MACINPDGTITESAKGLLRILKEPLALEEISKKSGQPLFKIRSSLREMVGAGLVQEEGEKYVATEEGKKKT
jgi:predicted transcriptional regulator